jgi:predicted nucleic-acid-binding protein
MEKELESAIADATSTYRTNQSTHADTVSLAYDAGRIAGLKEALELFDKIKEES